MQVRSVGAMRVLAIGLVTLIAVSGCQPEQRPVAGSVRTIGTPSSGSVSGSVSAPAPKPAVGVSPAVPSAELPAASATLPPSKPDGIYTPTTNREIYQAISSDYQAIVALTNQVNEGKPLPSAEILKIYEEASEARSGTSARLLGGFARDPARAQEFPDAAQFYDSPAFLDDPVVAAINGTGAAAQYSPAQRRQAIQKGVARIVYYWSRRYVEGAAANLNPGWVDEAWAVYMGKEVDGTYPNSISGIAVSRETNFNRPGSIDVPLRQALSRAQQAAANKDAAAYTAAANDVYSRFHTIFYLSTARYLNESLKSVQGGNPANASVQQMEGWSYYQSIQPAVAKADAAADQTIVAYFTAAPAALTVPLRDEALAALNRAASALRLTPADLVTPAGFN